MSNQPANQSLHEPDQDSREETRSMLDQLLSRSRLYRQSKDFKELLDFVARLRNFAPFNAMLLQIQKPGLSFAATAHDWWQRFERTPKDGARPLLILWPFGPVMLVYDVLDTEGKPLPEDVACFFARGCIDAQQMTRFWKRLASKCIDYRPVDAGDRQAGKIKVIQRPAKDKDPTHYEITINHNHGPAVQFATLAHELAHLFLGHLGLDSYLGIPDRSTLGHAQKELEAESVSYVVCRRNGVSSKSETYLTNYVEEHSSVDTIDLYQIMRAAGQVESHLGLNAPSATSPRAQPKSDDGFGSGTLFAEMED
jgi:hypothetical protein